MTKPLYATCCALLCGGSAALANADTFTATGPSSGGTMQNASATFVTGPGTLSITLNNLISNPKTIAQDISGIFFTLSSGATSGSLTSSSGIELNIFRNRHYSIGPTVSTGWALTSSGGTFVLQVLNTPEAPDHTIVGTSSNGTYSGGTYSKANSSLTGNGPHNPFLESGATFNLAVLGVTSSTRVTSATFVFNTVAGDTRVGIDPSTVPEPATGMLLLIGAVSAAGFLYHRRSRAIKGSNEA
jgi:hypothetical protein